MSNDAYNPLAKMHLAESIQRRFLEGPVLALADADDRSRAQGAGVYALYYTGSFELYTPIATLNSNGTFDLPIYVGKAIPSGGRVGGLRQAKQAAGALRDRLRRHAGSIDEVENLNLVDFSFRSLVVDDIWIPLGENMLIETFRPLWNTSLSGFGNNPTGGGRAEQAISLWDTLHPGRAGSGKAGGAKQERAIQAVREYCDTLRSQAIKTRTDVP